MSEHLPDIYTLYNTHPVVPLAHYSAKYALQGELLAYLNYGGPTATAKDSLAMGMLLLALEKGSLQPNQKIVEASSGTFAAALTIAALQLGHPVYLVVPASTSSSRQKYLQELGANITLGRNSSDASANIMQASALAKEINGYFVNYLSNDDNPEFHRQNTGPALLKALSNKIDTLVVAVGSGGTLTGTAEYLKAWLGDVWVVAVQPAESQVLTGGFAGKHGISGIGLSFIPNNYNPYIVDEIISVPSVDALDTASEILHLEGIPACPSAGAVLCAAKSVMAKRPSKTVCLFNGMQTYE